MCEFCKSSVRYFSHIVSDKGIDKHPDKTAAKETCSVPPECSALITLDYRVLSSLW